jgi:hypothetical protein
MISKSLPSVAAKRQGSLIDSLLSLMFPVMLTHHVRLIVAAAVTLLFCGCAMFEADGEPKNRAFPWSKTTQTDQNTVYRMAAGIEAGIIRRPGSDVRVRKLVWEHLDESGLMAPEVRQRLNQNGFRVGVAGSASPWALQSLVREATQQARGEQPGTADASESSHSVGPRFTVMKGGTSRLELQPFISPESIPVEQIPELADVRDLSNLKCTIELKVEDVDSEWVLLSLLPQFHVGARTARLSVEDSGEQLPIRQRVIPLYEQQCQIRLHQGEVAVVGLQTPDAWNAGRMFFAPDDSTAGQESLLLIRLAGIDGLKGQSAAAGAIASKYTW